MKKPLIFLAAAMLLTAMIPRNLAAEPAAVSAADPIRILPVGDSITEGFGETGGYRKYLDYELKQQGISFDMVGPQRDGQTSFNYNGQQVQYDGNHAGYGGYTIKQQYPIPNWGRNGLLERLQEENTVKKEQPDIILLMIGTNDMTANRNVNDCENDLHSLLDYMIGDMPQNCMIFLASIPEFTQYGGNPQRIGNYNNTVKKVASDYENAGKHVRFADVHSSLTTADLASDQLHPNGGGYEKIGKFWAATLVEYLKSSIETTTVTTTTTTETTTTTTTTETTTTTTETTTTTTTTTTTEATTTELPAPLMRGDINCSGKVDVSDAVLLARVIAEDKSAVVSPQGLINADADGNGQTEPNDIVIILQFVAKIITAL